MSNEFENKKCFVITPIGSDRSEIRDALDGLLKNVLEPVLLDLGFKDKDITVAHQMKDSGSINTQLITRIIEDDLCLVNLTGLNPNVMYELAIRHAVGKPVVIIAENGTKLPFDIIDQRTIFYSNTMLGAVQLKETLKEMIINIYSTHEKNVDNPIIKIIRENAILDKITSDGSEHNELSLILDKIVNLEDKFIRLNTGNRGKVHPKNLLTERWILENNNGPIEDYTVILRNTPNSTSMNYDETNQIELRFPYNLSMDEAKVIEDDLKDNGIRLLKKTRRLD